MNEWCVQVMRSQIEPMQKVVRMLRRHHPLLLNWFRARGQISVGSVEGFNNKAGSEREFVQAPVNAGV